MGLIFQKQVPSESAVRQQIEAALLTQPPTTESQTNQAVNAMTVAATGGGIAFNWRGFLLLAIITGALLALAVWLDWKNIVDDPKVYSGLAGTALGAILGFITGDAVGTAS